MASKEKSVLYHIPKDFNKVKKICENPNYIKIFHSITSDIFWLKNIGINVSLPYHDTMIMASLIQNELSSKGLKDLVKRHLNESCNESTILKKYITKYKKKHEKIWELYTLIKQNTNEKKLLTRFKSFTRSYYPKKYNYVIHKNNFYNNVIKYIKNYCDKHKYFTWDLVPRKYMDPYAVKDAEYTYLLYQIWKDKIKKNYADIYKLELKLIPIIINMQYRGHRIDRPLIKKIIKNNSKMLRNTDRDLYRKLGVIININSGKQLAKALEDIGVPLIEQTKKGNISVAKDSLIKLRLKYPEYGDIVSLILRHKFLSKRLTTYYTSLLNSYTTEEDDIAHFQFWQAGTRTGRFSAELIQTIPRASDQIVEGVKDLVRFVFIPRKDYVNIYIDYNQMEFRLFACFSENKDLIQYFLDGKDPFVEIAINIFGKETYNKDPKGKRNIIKRLSYGVIYGMGVDLLSTTLGISYTAACEILTDYNNKYGIKDYMYKVIQEVYKNKCLRLNWINRTYKLEDKFAYKGVNYNIQGSGSYIIKLGMLKVDKYIKENNLTGKVNLLLTIHDELVYEIHKSVYNKKIIKHIKYLMEDKRFAIPLTADVSYSKKSWGNKKDLIL